MPIVLGISQLYTGTDTVVSDQFTYLRAAEMAVAEDSLNAFGTHAYDLTQLGDGIHQAQASYPIYATRLAPRT